jgi:hypothetical protein
LTARFRIVRPMPKAAGWIEKHAFFAPISRKPDQRGLQNRFENFRNDRPGVVSLTVRTQVRKSARHCSSLSWASSLASAKTFSPTCLRGLWKSGCNQNGGNPGNQSLRSRIRKCQSVQPRCRCRSAGQLIQRGLTLADLLKRAGAICSGPGRRRRRLSGWHSNWLKGSGPKEAAAHRTRWTGFARRRPLLTAREKIVDYHGRTAVVMCWRRTSFLQCRLPVRRGIAQ